MSQRTAFDDNPLVRYTDRHLWGNPEEDSQFQVVMNKISPDLGFVKNFTFMGRNRALPKANKFYHMFNIGGLHAGYWNFVNKLRGRNPLDRWINLSLVGKARGLQIDLYNTKGMQFPRTKAWVMVTYDGLVLIALEKLIVYPIPLLSKMYFRCYTSSLNIARWEAANIPQNNPFVYESMTYESSAELQVFQGRYGLLKAKPGFTGVFHNGVFTTKVPSALKLTIGDEVEIWHDPSIIKVERYNYAQLSDYYSDMDKKRKVILHSPKVNGDFRLRYFDDNDYYLVGGDGYGLYYHRNDETVVRQLTHIDVALSDDQIKVASQHIKSLNDLSKLQVYVFVRDTDWKLEWPNEAQRVRQLYRLDDQGIVNAMTGPLATLKEWTAQELESGAVQTLMHTQFNDVTTEKAFAAIGYNAATRVLSDSPLKVEFQAGAVGVAVPPTYAESYTAWEYDEQGILIDFWHVSNAGRFMPRNSNCKLVEFTLGNHGRNFHYEITNEDFVLPKGFSYEVYKVKWNIISDEPASDPIYITGTGAYEEVDGVLKWKTLDVVNERAIVLINDQVLAYQFELDHIDHSLSFAITHIYEGGGLIFPFTPANCDLWLNGHPLIDNVDWFFEDSRFYIHNKEFIVDGPQVITFRGHGVNGRMDKPITETELGFVEGGVIGNVPRYNIREDRVTRCVIGGRLFLTDDVPAAETTPASDLWDELNGRPYMVKHVYCPIRFVNDYHNYIGYAESRDLDKRVVDYLTEHCEKPKPLVIPDLQDKYRLYSPFMNVIVNGIINRLITLPPKGGDNYTEQEVYDTVKPYLWWLKYDPIIKEFDERYFALMPFANVGKLTMTADELIFLMQVNKQFLRSVCRMEGHFEVNNYVR